jgi:hypothetical protein
MGGVSEQADTRSPGVVLRDSFRVDDNLVGEGVGVGGGDGRNVVFVSVYDSDDLMRRFLEGLGHGTANFEHIYLVVSNLLCP